MELLLWTFFGVMGGWIASVIYESKDTYGFQKDVLLGIIGAVAAGLVINSLGYRGITSYNAFSVLTASIFIISLIGAKRLFEIQNKGKELWQS